MIEQELIEHVFIITLTVTNAGFLRWGWDPKGVGAGYYSMLTNVRRKLHNNEILPLRIRQYLKTQT